MRPHKPNRLDREHPEAALNYPNANRDRALGEADRTGRHFDEDAEQSPDEGAAASKEHEAD